MCANLAPQPCIRLDLPAVRTMKQLCASVASSEAAGPFSRRRPSHAITRVATTSDRHQRPFAQARRGAETVFVLVIFAGRSRNDRAHAHTVRDFAGGDQSPHCDQQLAGEGHDHGGLALPLCQCAVFLKPKEAPRELDQSAAYPGIARLRQPLFSPFGATFVWRAGQPCIARHCPAIAQLPG